MKHQKTKFDKLLEIAAGTLKNSILPAADKILVPICPKCSANLKNIWANYDEKKGRPMIYPYTHTAKLVQYPFQWFFKHGWVVKYFLISFVVCVPIFHSISNIVNTPKNKLYWKELRNEWYGKHDHH